MDCHVLLRDFFPTQGSNLGLLHCGRVVYQLSTGKAPDPKQEAAVQTGKRGPAGCKLDEEKAKEKTSPVSKNKEDTAEKQSYSEGIKKD